MSPAPFPVLPPGGLTAAHRARFMFEAQRAHMEAIYSNGKEAVQAYCEARAVHRALSDLWDAYNNEDAAVEPDGTVTAEITKPLSWLGYDHFTPVLAYYSTDSIENLIHKVEEYDAYILESSFLWDWFWGVAGIVEDGAEPSRFALIQSPFFPEHSADMRKLSEEQLGEFFKKQSEMKIQFLIPYNMKSKDGERRRGQATLEISFKLLRFSAAREFRLSRRVRLSFGAPAPFVIGSQGEKQIPAELWSLAEGDAQRFVEQNQLAAAVDWAACLSAALLVEPPEPPDPNQLEIPLEVSEKVSIADVIELATFAFPSDTASRLVTQAWGAQAPKEQKELSRILEKPMATRTPQEIRRIAEIKGGLILSQKTIYGDDYSPVGVTLETKIRETNSVTAKALVTVRAESPADGTAVTQSHIDEAIEMFFRHFAATFHGQGLRHWALILKELIQNAWVYEFETSEHIAKMRTLKPGESPSKEERQRAQSIVTYLCDTFLDVQSKKGQKHAARAQRFFYIDARTKDKRRGEVFTIRATPELMTLFRSSAGSALQYVPMLESIVREDHQDHGIAIALYFHLAPLWRMDPIRKMKVRDVFDLIGKDPSPENEHRKRDLKKLETELDYMVAQAPPYLGAWEASGGDADRPSKCRQADPFEVELILTAPDWKRERIDRIQANRAAFLPKPAPKAPQAMEPWQLEEAIRLSGLSANRFAEAAGISRGHLSKVRTGTKEITPGFEAKIRAKFPLCFPS